MRSPLLATKFRSMEEFDSEVEANPGVGELHVDRGYPHVTYTCKQPISGTRCWSRLWMINLKPSLCEDLERDLHVAYR